MPGPKRREIPHQEAPVKTPEVQEVTLDTVEDVSANVQEQSERGKQELTDVAAEVRIDAETLVKLKNEFERISKEANFEDADDVATKLQKATEAHFGAPVEKVLDVGRRASVLFTIGELGRDAFRILKAEPEKRGEVISEYFSTMWKTAKQFNPLLPIGEGLYYLGEAGVHKAQGEEEKSEEALQNLKATAFEAVPVLKFLAGDKGQQQEFVQEVKVSAILGRDAILISTLLTKGATMEALKQAGKATKYFEAVIHGAGALEKKAEGGEVITGMDVLANFVEAGAKATGQSPEKFIESLAPSLRDEEMLKEIPEESRAAIQVFASLLEQKEGQRLVLDQMGIKPSKKAA